MGVRIKKYGQEVTQNGNTTKIKGNRATRTQTLSDLTKTATPDQRAMIEELRNQYSKYKTDLRYGMSPVSAARYQDDFNQKVVDILNGKITDPSQLYSSTNLDTVQENRHGRYSSANIDAMGDAASKRYGKENGPATTTTETGATTGAPAATDATPVGTTAQPNMTTGKANYNFNALEGLSSFSKDLYSDDDWRSKLLETISGNLTKASQALDRGDNVWWGTGSNLSKEDVALMQGVLGKQTVWSDLSAAREQAKALDSVFSKLGINSPELLSYFRFGETDEEKRLRTMADKGYTPSNMTFDTPAADYLSQQGWTPWKYGNKTVLLDKDDNPITTSSIKFWQDPTKAGYGNVFAVGPDGSFYYGTTNVADDSPFRDQIVLGLQKQQEQNKQTFSRYNYGGDYQYPELIQQVGKIEGMNPTMSYVDVSNRFSGTNPVIAVSGNGSSDVPVDQFGNPNLSDPNVRLFTMGQDGKYIERPYDEMIAGGYRVGGYPEEVSEQLIPTDPYLYIKNIQIPAEDLISGDRNMYSLGILERPWTSGWNRDIKEDPVGFVNMMISALANSNQSFPVGQNDSISAANLLQNYKANTPEGRAKLIANLYKFIQTNKIQLSPEMKQLFSNVVRDYNKQVNTGNQKSESVESAKQGTILGADGKYYTPDQLTVPKTEVKPSKHATGKQQAEADRLPSEDFKGVDVLRFAGLAADAVSLISSFIPGVGTAISAVTGIGSSLTSFAADMQDGFQWKDLRDLGINIGLDVAGLFGGAGKMVKLTKKLKRFMPYIEGLFVAGGALNAVANADAYAQVFKKLDVGQSLTIDDWRTIADGLTLAAGATRMGSSVFKQKRIKNLQGKTQTSEASWNVPTNKKDVKLTKAQIDEINAVKPVEGQTSIEAKNKKLQEITGQSDIEFIADKGPWSIKHPFSRGTTDDINLKDIDFTRPDHAGVSGSEAEEAMQTLKKYQRRAFGMSDYDIYTRRNGNPLTPAAPTRPATPSPRTTAAAPAAPVSTAAPARPAAPVSTPPYTEQYYKRGGKLERLQAYINSK